MKAPSSSCQPPPCAAMNGPSSAVRSAWALNPKSVRLPGSKSSSPGWRPSPSTVSAPASSRSGSVGVDFEAQRRGIPLDRGDQPLVGHQDALLPDLGHTPQPLLEAVEVGGRALPPGHGLAHDLADLQQIAAGVRLGEVGRVHPEHVGQVAGGDVERQLGPVVLPAQHLELDLDPGGVGERGERVLVGGGGGLVPHPHPQRVAVVELDRPVPGAAGERPGPGQAHRSGGEQELSAGRHGVGAFRTGCRASQAVATSPSSAREASTGCCGVTRTVQPTSPGAASAKRAAQRPSSPRCSGIS